MAQKTDMAADKARKQKIILAVAGVLLVGLAVIQVPKLMKGNDAPAAAAAPAAETAPAATSTGTPTTAAAVTSTTVTTVSTAKPAAFVAGVGLPGTQHAEPAKSQLASFTLFDRGDPFVQQVSDSTGAPADATAPTPAEPAGSAAPAPAASSGGSSSGGDTGAGAKAPEPEIAYATIMLDGKPQQLQVKDKFPKNDPMFVLVSLKKKQAKIGVAGGSFDDGQAVTLKLGKKVTLLNTATGVRYELKLVYTGATPEVIEGFTTKTDAAASDGAAASDASTVSATPTTTTTP